MINNFQLDYLSTSVSAIKALDRQTDGQQNDLIRVPYFSLKGTEPEK